MGYNLDGKGLLRFGLVFVRKYEKIVHCEVNTLDFASRHQSCTLASQRTTFTNRVNCILYPWYLICSQGKFFHNRANCSCNRFIIIVYGRVIFVYRLVVLLIYQGGNGFTHVSNIGFTHVLGSGFTHVLGFGFP